MTTEFTPITKPPIDEFTVRPNLDHESDLGSVDWQEMIDELDWLPGGGLNVAHEAIDRHALNRETADRVAMIWEGRNGEREDYTFAQMKEESDKFANVLKSLGIELGDRVFVLMERVPELYFAFLGILKVGAVAGPLASGLGSDAVKDRLQDSAAKVVVTQSDQRRKITPIIPELFELQHIVVVNKNGRDPEPLDYQDLSYEEEMSKAPSDFQIVNTSQNDSSVMLYTSDTTERPKGAIHRHHAVIQQYATAKWCLDLHSDDVYWCTTDPGGSTGTVYGVLTPWTIGVTQLIYEGEPVASSWYELVQKHSVTVWYTSRTVIRMLMEAGDELPRRGDLSSLRFSASAGGRLEPDAVMWGHEVLGQAFHDNWLQAETGAILCANYAAMDVRPGSMGRPTPGVELAILGDDFKPVGPGVDGNLAVRPGWPSMFQDYWNETEAYNSRFRRGWYITGDRANVDEDGYFWLV